MRGFSFQNKTAARDAFKISPNRNGMKPIKNDFIQVRCREILSQVAPQSKSKKSARQNIAIIKNRLSLAYFIRLATKIAAATKPKRYPAVGPAR
jgi:hypothetical protein